jgi:hypothetical protein
MRGAIDPRHPDALTVSIADRAIERRNKIVTSGDIREGLFFGNTLDK